VIRYVAEVSDEQLYLLYTQRKDFCGDNSPNCNKDTCPANGDELYPMIASAEVRGTGQAWRNGNWLEIGGIYKDHDNHGNCHGAMTSCSEGWIDTNGGHVCLWISTNVGMWFNYGPYTGGYYPGTIWIRPSVDDLTRYNSYENPAIDCYEIYKGDRTSKSGVYWVKKGGYGPSVRVYCDMGDHIGDTGGWTLVYKTSTDFGTTWNGGFQAGEYKPGMLDIEIAHSSAKFSDRDINSWLSDHWSATDNEWMCQTGYSSTWASEHPPSGSWYPGHALAQHSGGVGSKWDCRDWCLSNHGAAAFNWQTNSNGCRCYSREQADTITLEGDGWEFCAARKGDRVIRYVGHEDNSDSYLVQYSMHKDFCSDNSPNCPKISCADGLYPWKGGRETIAEPVGNIWNGVGESTGSGSDGSTGWYNVGGVYDGHDNHGNCHGAMSSCTSGWANDANQGHICVWNDRDTPGIWWNYGDFVGGMRTSGTIWVRRVEGTPAQETGYESNSVGSQCLPH